MVPTERLERSSVSGWAVFAAVLTAAVFLQAVTAGRILSGDDWARDVHRIFANVLSPAAIVGGIVALVRLRDRAGGRRFGLLLVAIGVGLLVQHGLGAAAADGDDTLWIHIPVGVALVGLLVHAVHSARRIGAAEYLRTEAGSALHDG